MKQVFRVCLVGITLACLGGFCGISSAQQLSGEEKVLNIANWEGYFGETTLADFTAETGITVNYDAFDAVEVMEAKLLAGNSQFDVVFPSASGLAEKLPTGLYRKLDREALTNWGNLDADFLSHLAALDPGNEHAVPYMRGTSGIVYDIGAMEERLPDGPADGWDLVFNPDLVSRFADCGVFFMDAPNEVVSAALNYIGLDPNSENPDDLQAAMDLLSKVRPYIRHLNNGQIITDLAQGNICVALTYSGDAATAAWAAEEAGQTRDLAYMIPKEGAEIWFDVMAIPADAPHPGNAHLFLNYMMRPDVIAGVTNAVFYANAIAKSRPFISKEILEDPMIYSDRENMENLFVLTPKTHEFIRQRTRAWTAFKYGR